MGKAERISSFACFRLVVRRSKQYSQEREFEKEEGRTGYQGNTNFEVGLWLEFQP
jgi:hypothetical protein